MRITIESTTKIVTVNGVPARVWEGTTEAGAAVICFITRVASPRPEGMPVDEWAARCRELDVALSETRAPSAESQSFSSRLIL